MYSPKINGIIYSIPLESKEEIQLRLRQKEILKAKSLLVQATKILQESKLPNIIITKIVK